MPGREAWGLPPWLDPREPLHLSRPQYGIHDPTEPWRNSYQATGFGDTGFTHWYDNSVAYQGPGAGEPGPWNTNEDELFSDVGNQFWTTRRWIIHDRTREGSPVRIVDYHNPLGFANIPPPHIWER